MNGHSHTLAVLSEIKLPKGYIYDKHNRLVFQTEVGSGEAKDTVVSIHPIYLAGVYRSEAGDSGGRVLAFEQYHPHHGWNSITIPQGQLHSASGLTMLGDGGANIRDPALFRNMVVQCIDQCNNDSDQQPCYEQLGWKLDAKGKRISILLGTSMYQLGGTVDQVIVTSELQHRAAGMGPREGGDFREWRRIVSTLIPPTDYAGQLTLLYSFASIFMSWMASDESGGIVNNREISSGTGKTTRLKCACSIWGQWHSLRITNYDTKASQGYLRSRINHFPVFHDEIDKQIKNRELQALYEYIMNMNEGTDKTRMEQGGKRTLMQTTSYNCLELSATNLSIIDSLEALGGSDAAIQRVLEMISKSPQHLDPTYADELKEELKAHSGTAGDIFLKHLLDPDIMKFTAQQLKANQSWLYKNTQFKQRDRFSVRKIAAAMTAGELCDQIAGFLWFDWREAVRWLIQSLGVDANQPEKLEKGPDGGNGVEAMRQYLMLHSNNVLRVPGPFVVGAQPFEIAPKDLPYGKLVLRVEKASRRAYTPYKDFQKFCVENGYSTPECVAMLESIGYVLRHDRQISLAAGTHLQAVRSRCLEIDTSHELAASLPKIDEPA